MFENVLVQTARRFGSQPVSDYGGQLEEKVERAKQKPGRAALMRRLRADVEGMHPDLHKAARLYCTFVFRKESDAPAEPAVKPGNKRPRGDLDNEEVSRV